MDGATDEPTPVSPPARAPKGAELGRALGLSPSSGEALLQAGHSDPDAVRRLSDDDLAKAGISADDVAKLRAAPANGNGARAPLDSDRILERWVGSVRRPERGRKKRPAAPVKESADVLRKWVEGDDRAMEDWIRSSESVRAPPPSVPVPASPVAPGEPPEAGAARPLEFPSAVISDREETVVRWLTGLLDRVKTDQFDPSTLIQEAQDLHRQLFDERAKRKQLEDEIEHVKRGSIAVIKYVRSREAKEREIAIRSKDDEIAELKLRLLALEGVDGQPPPSATPAGGTELAPSAVADAAEKVGREVDSRLREEFAEREHEYIERETELRRRIVQLEGEVRNLRSEADRFREQEQLLTGARGALPEEVRERLREVDSREKDLVARENALRTRFEEIRIQAEDIERRRSPLEFKERELEAYEQQIQTRKQALDIEARRLEELRREIGPQGSATASDEARRVEDLRHQLEQKEADLRAREGALRERVVELEKMSGKAAEAEADRMHEEAVADVTEAKVKSGVRRLDDLLFGGFPSGAQVLVNGPAHTGKDVLARLFSVEGLRLGIPSIWVVTDKTWGQVRDDLAALYPKYAEAEKSGMVRFVDLYSRSVGSNQSAPGVRLLSSTDKAILEQLSASVNGFSEELKSHFPAYRLVFESVSTMTAYLDTSSAFRFLQPFVGRRRIDGAAAFYVLETGMHSEADLETLEHMVDGSVNLKVEQLKTFLSVRGIAEAQSRAWIGYTFTKRSLNLGSFSLDHIR